MRPFHWSIGYLSVLFGTLWVDHYSPARFFL